MSLTLDSLLQKAENEEKIDQTYEYLAMVKQFFESKSENFFLSQKLQNTQAILPICEVSVKKHFILATNNNDKAFQQSIRENLGEKLRDAFLDGFIGVVQRRISLIRHDQKHKEFRGELLTLAKCQKDQKIKKSKHYPSLDKPFLFRLNYQIFHKNISNTSLTGTVSQIILLAFTLSSIKKDHFSDWQLSYFIENGYQLLSQYPSQNGVTTKYLSDELNNLTQLHLNLNNQVFTYKGLDINNLVYDDQASSQSNRQLQKLSTSKNTNLVLIHTKWEDGKECYGTGFIFNHKAFVTSPANVQPKGNIHIKSIKVYLSPQNLEKDHFQVDGDSISNFGSLALVLIPSDYKLQKRAPLKIQDNSSSLPMQTNYLYVYGYEFKQGEGDSLIFHSVVTPHYIGENNTFDSFWKIKSRASRGSLVFFVRNNELTVFGVYSPYNNGVLNFNLVHGEISQKIHSAIANKKVMGIIGEDDRVEIPKNKLKSLPYSAIGIIYSTVKVYNKNNVQIRQSVAQGSGAFIAPNIILTCAHNVISYNFKQEQHYVSQKIIFRPGFSRSDNLLQGFISGLFSTQYTIQAEDMYITPTYRNNYSKGGYDRVSSDFAILYLKDKNHSSHVGYRQVQLSNKQFWNQTQLLVCGYPGETVGKMREAKGKAIIDPQKINQLHPNLHEIVPNMLYFTIDITAGNSGGPILYKDQEEFKAVGVATHGFSLPVNKPVNEQTENRSTVNGANLLAGLNYQFLSETLEKLSKNQPSINFKEIIKADFEFSNKQ